MAISSTMMAMMMMFRPGPEYHSVWILEPPPLRMSQTGSPRTRADWLSGRLPPRTPNERTAPLGGNIPLAQLPDSACSEKLKDPGLIAKLVNRSIGQWLLRVQNDACLPEHDHGGRQPTPDREKW